MHLLLYCLLAREQRVQLVMQSSCLRTPMHFNAHKTLGLLRFCMGFWMMYTGCRGPEAAAGKRQSEGRAAAGGVDQSTDEQ